MRPTRYNLLNLHLNDIPVIKSIDIICINTYKKQTPELHLVEKPNLKLKLRNIIH